MNNLFSYGSLQIPEVMFAVTGYAHPGKPATLADYTCCRIANNTFPGIRPQPNGRCHGTLYLNVPEESWAQLDEFEDDFYVRRIVTVWVGKQRFSANIYEIAEESLEILSDEPWDLQEFKTFHLERFLKRCDARRRLP